MIPTFSARLRLSQAVLELVKLRPSIIRGNASEIMALAGAAGVTRGVDSTAEPEEALQLAKQLALEAGCVVAVSGAVDLVCCGTKSHFLSIWV